MKKFKRLILLICVILIAFFALKSIVKGVYPLKYENYVTKYSQKYDVDKNLLFAVIKAESNFDKNAQSGKNACGLMQIIEPTGEWIADKIGIADFTKDMLFDAETNIEMGAFYMSYLLDMYNGDKKCAVCAYNAGFANVDSWLLSKKYSHDGKTLQNIAYPETEKYVNLVFQNEKIYEYLYKER